MRQSRSTKKGLATAYVSTVVGIVMVLFIVGGIAWFALGLNNFKDSRAESYEFDVYFSESVNAGELGIIESEIANKDYTASAFYRTDEEAWEITKEMVGGDSALTVLDGENPMSDHVIMTLKKDYFSQDSMNVIEKDLKADYGARLDKIDYQPEIFAEVSSGLQKIIYFTLFIGAMLLFIAVGMINNTIRLALFSKRFTIKTMQLVGATPKFIRKPFLMTAIGQGLLSGLIAGALVLGMITLLIKYDPVFLDMTDMTVFMMVQGFIILFGIILTVCSTYFALNKYLRLSLDKLY